MRQQRPTNIRNSSTPSTDSATVSGLKLLEGHMLPVDSPDSVASMQFGPGATQNCRMPKHRQYAECHTGYIGPTAANALTVSR